MTFKKNLFSIFLWAFCAFAVCVFHIRTMLELLVSSSVVDTYLQIGIVCLSFILAAGIFFLCRKLFCIYPVQTDTAQSSRIMWEVFLAFLLLGAGLFLRIYFIGNGGEEAAYYETARVTGEAVAPIAHGAQYLYVLLLRGLFIFAGNHFSAGIILQIGLQMAAAAVWYFAVRRLWGPVAALILLAGIMLSPESIKESLFYSPKMLFLLLYGIVLLMAGRILRRQRYIKPLKWYSFVQTFLLGACIGFLSYLDVTGLTLFIPVVFICFIRIKENEENAESLFSGNAGSNAGRIAGQLLIVAAGCFLTAFLLFYGDAVYSATTPDRVFGAWCTLFSPKGLVGLPGSFLAETMMEKWLMTGVSFLLLLGIFAFFVRPKEENQILPFLMLFGVGFLHAGGFAAKGMNCNYILLLLVLVLTGAGIQAMFTKSEPAPAAELPKKKRTVKEPVQKMQKPEASQKPETAPKPETAQKPKIAPKPEASPKPETPPEPVPEKKVKYIENPLPLPKKHVKKKMGYRQDVLPEQFDYDLKVSDEDDFDI